LFLGCNWNSLLLFHKDLGRYRLGLRLHYYRDLYHNRNLHFRDLYHRDRCYRGRCDCRDRRRTTEGAR
jgi:hypothetical protein